MHTPLSVAAYPKTPPAPIFGLSSIVVAGLLGGPVAASLLVARNGVVGGESRRTTPALSFFVLASAAWFWVLYNVPRDALSELMAHLPQVLIWWLVGGLLLRKAFISHSAAGGELRSVWVAAGVGLLVAVALRVLLRVLLPSLL